MLDLGGSGMGISLRKHAVIRFGGFEADLRLRQLSRGGQRIAIQEKPFEVLAALLEKPGEIVGREELCAKLWPGLSYGDVDHNLHVCVTKLRRALADVADNPRYIQTLSGRGYRIITPVEIEENWQQESLGVALRIAVLPFENFGLAAEQTFFSDGIAAEIITCLAHLYPHRLAVVARSSILRYRGTAKSAAQIGSELKVDYILEGSVQMAQEHMHITAQLVRVRDRACLWAEPYDYTGGDYLTIQNEIAERVAQSLGLKLLPDLAAASLQQTTRIPEAHRAYLKGCYYQSRATEDALTKSLECFGQAIQLDPAFALAHCGIAYSYSLLGLLGLARAPKQYFLPAAEVDPGRLAGQCGGVHARLGHECRGIAIS